MRPLAYDQFDNALRLLRLGAARSLTTRRYRARAVAEALEELTRSDAVRETALALQKRMSGEDVVGATASMILKELTGTG